MTTFSSVAFCCCTALFAKTYLELCKSLNETYVLIRSIDGKLYNSDKDKRFQFFAHARAVPTDISDDAS